MFVVLTRLRTLRLIDNLVTVDSRGKACQVLPRIDQA
jgi:hypothetical protein